MARLTYRSAGVDIHAGDALVQRIKPLARGTRRAEVLADIGGFAGLCALPPGMREPVLVSGTDGVGTKLKIAFMTGRHDTVGIDLVAMCVNDVATTGADVLFFLDYFATGTLDVGVAERVVSGIALGCRDAGCALLGGETAEMPGMYGPNEYDLAGFAVGVVERDRLLDGTTTEVGDVAVGVFSSGLHSNGFALVRSALLDTARLSLDQPWGSAGGTLADELLLPTRIYVRPLRKAMASGQVHGVAHITGGGLVDNIPRVLPDGTGVLLDPRRWQRPEIFDLIQRSGNVAEAEMRRTFNLGIGLVVIAHAKGADSVLDAFRAAGMGAAIIGEVVSSSAPEDTRVAFVGD